MERHSLITDESVEAWIDENDPDGASKLLQALQLGHITGARARYVAAWFDRSTAAARTEQAAVEGQRAERNITAAERSANAAESAAASARVSARLALVGALVALAALFVSAWPYFFKPAGG